MKSTLFDKYWTIPRFMGNVAAELRVTGAIDLTHQPQTLAKLLRAVKCRESRSIGPRER